MRIEVCEGCGRGLAPGESRYDMVVYREYWWDGTAVQLREHRRLFCGRCAGTT